jgi:hypothetical protein
MLPSLLSPSPTSTYETSISISLFLSFSEAFKSSSEVDNLDKTPSVTFFFSSWRASDQERQTHRAILVDQEALAVSGSARIAKSPTLSAGSELDASNFPRFWRPIEFHFWSSLGATPYTRMNKEKPNCVDELKPSPDFTSHRLAFAHLPSGSKSKMMGAPKLTADAACTVQTQVTTMERRPSRQQPACFAGPNLFADNAMVRAGGIRFPDSLGAGQRSINSPGNMFCLDVTLAPC